jgi:TPR repeat protein
MNESKMAATRSTRRRRAWWCGAGLALPLFVFAAQPAFADYQSGLAAFDRGDYAKALTEWRPLAEQGDAQAQHGLGMIYEVGNGIGSAGRTSARRCAGTRLPRRRAWRRRRTTWR